MSDCVSFVEPLIYVDGPLTAGCLPRATLTGFGAEAFSVSIGLSQHPVGDCVSSSCCSLCARTTSAFRSGGNVTRRTTAATGRMSQQTAVSVGDG